MTDKVNQVWFFEETFLVANVSPEVVLEMFFHTLNGADINFLDQKLCWKTYIIKKTLSTIKRIKWVSEKAFVAVVLDPEIEIFIVYVASFNSTTSLSSAAFLSSTTSLSSTLLHADIYPSHRSLIASLIIEKTPTKVPNKYVDFADIFFLDLVSKLPKHTRINNYAIKLVNGQLQPYGPIYSLKLIELKTLKAYIEINLANGFIRPSKLPIDASMFFEQKSDSFFRLCINYKGFNNLTIKNWYPLPLVKELLDRLEKAGRFTQFDFISIYYQIRICKGDE